MNLHIPIWRVDNTSEEIALILMQQLKTLDDQSTPRMKSLNRKAVVTGDSKIKRGSKENLQNFLTSSKYKEANESLQIYN
jgi:hypothetical protein